MVVVVPVTLGSSMARRSNALAGFLIGKIATDLGSHFVKACEENGLFILTEAVHVALRPFSKQETATSCDLKALMHKLVLIGVSDKAEVDLGPPYRLAVLLLVEFPFAVESCQNIC